MSTLVGLLTAFDEADAGYRSALAVGRAQSGMDGPMGLYQTQSMPTPDIDGTRASRNAAIRALRDHLAGDQGKLAQLDIYIDLNHDPSAQAREVARQQLAG